MDEVFYISGIFIGGPCDGQTVPAVARSRDVWRVEGDMTPDGLGFYVEPYERRIFRKPNERMNDYVFFVFRNVPEAGINGRAREFLGS